MADTPFFSDSQLENLDTRLGNAERDLAGQMHMKSIVPGEDQKYLEFNAVNFLRRLLVEVQHHRANSAQK